MMFKLSETEKINLEEQLIEYVNKYLTEYKFEQQYELSSHNTKYKSYENIRIFGKPKAISFSNSKPDALLDIQLNEFAGQKNQSLSPHLSHILQLATYLYLFQINTGFICWWDVSYINEIISENPLQLISSTPKITYYDLKPKCKGFKSREIKVTILKEWKSKGNPITIWKIQINDMSNLENIFQEISNWWKDKLRISPKKREEF